MLAKIEALWEWFALSCLGDFYSYDGDYKEALKHYKESFSIKDKVFGAFDIQSLETAFTSGRIADCLIKLVDYKAALIYLNKQYKIFKPTFGEKSQAVAKIWRLRGKCFQNLSDDKNATECFQKEKSIKIDLEKEDSFKIPQLKYLAKK